MAKNFTVPKSITGRNTFCNGCGHSIIIKTICQLVDEMDLIDKCEIVHGVGCCTMLGINHVTKMSCTHWSHGKTLAAATGVARCVGEGILVIAYHGDGDAYNIGLSETSNSDFKTKIARNTVFTKQKYAQNEKVSLISPVEAIPSLEFFRNRNCCSETFNAGYRNENIVDIVVNNSLYGMTGGQMSHTTLIGEWTENYPEGRDPEVTGYPLRYPEMVRYALPHAFLARGGVFNPGEVRKSRDLLRKAFGRQLAGDGYSLIEILSMCPTNAHKSPLEVRDWVEKDMAAYYPMGVIQEGRSRGLIENF